MKGWGEDTPSSMAMDSPYASLDRKLKSVSGAGGGMTGDFGGLGMGSESSMGGTPMSLGGGEGYDHLIRQRQGQGQGNERGDESLGGGSDGGDTILGQPTSGQDQAGQGQGQREWEEEPSVLLNRSLDPTPSAPSRTMSMAMGLNSSPPPSKLNAFASPSRSKAAQNPFLYGQDSPGMGIPGSPGGKGNGKGWNGIADLRTTPLNPRVKKFRAESTGKDKGKGKGKGKGREMDADLDDDFNSDLDDEGLPDHSNSTNLIGTPPITMNFSLPQRTLNKTPVKDAARAVIRDLLNESFSLDLGGLGEDSPGMGETPEGFGRYGGLRERGRARGGEGSPSKGGSGMGEGEGEVTMMRLGGDGNETAERLENLSLRDGSPQPPQQPHFDPDISTVGMPRPAQPRAARKSIHPPELERLARESGADTNDFLDESFEDSLDELIVPEGYDLPRHQHREEGEGGRRDVMGETDSNTHTQTGMGNGQGEDGEEEGEEGQEQGDYTETDMGMGAGRGDMSMSSGTSSTRSEAGRVFGGRRVGGGQGRGLQLFGPDEMQTFHGGVSGIHISSDKSQELTNGRVA